MTDSKDHSDAAIEADEQYGAFTTDDGETIVYDRANAEAWIQSDYAVEVGGAPSSA